LEQIEKNKALYLAEANTVIVEEVKIAEAKNNVEDSNETKENS